MANAAPNRNITSIWNRSFSMHGYQLALQFVGDLNQYSLNVYRVNGKWVVPIDTDCQITKSFKHQDAMVDVLPDGLAEAIMALGFTFINCLAVGE